MSEDKVLSDLEINRAMAEVQGHYLCEEWDCAGLPGDVLIGRGNGDFKSYNPITDKALNLELRDEYKVEINYFHKRVIIYNHDTGQTWRIEYEDESQINRSVLLCILESVK